MPQYQDIDLYGRDNADGTPLMYYAANAIKNALTQWMNSKRGEYLMNPVAGGPLDVFLFKTLTADNVMILKAQLLSALTVDFAPSISVQDITIEVDVKRNITEIEIFYTIPQEGISDSVSLFLNTKYSINTFEYEDIDYVGSNLYEFVKLKKPDLSSSKLLYDYEINSWKWGKYKLIALVPTDPYFGDILMICNGS
jgi:hypothetical protein